MNQLKDLWSKEHTPHLIVVGLVLVLFIIVFDTRVIEDSIYLGIKIAGIV